MESLLEVRRYAATVGIGHTRWATHGIPNDENAHPHTDCTGELAIVHNGIIENYEELRDRLIKAGHAFHSETDTEVVAHLIEDELKKSADLFLAVKGAVNQLQGAYALGIVSQKHPDRIYAVNHHYSLAVGLGDQETYLASDSIAVCQYTNKVLRLEQSEIAEITIGGAKLFSFDGKEVKRLPIDVDAVPYIIDKKGHKHFLLKEIHEQPLVLRKTLSKYLHSPDKPVNFTYIHAEGNGNGAGYGIHLSDADLKRINRIKVVACGTAYHAGLIGKHVIEDLVGIPVDVEMASETRSRRLLVDKDTLVVAVSQSGETADTLAAISAAQKAGAITLGITNRPDSQLAHTTANLIVTECGIEVSVAATKTFTAQLATFYLLALYLAEKRQTLEPARIREMKSILSSVPTLMEQALSREAIMKRSINQIR